MIPRLAIASCLVLATSDAGADEPVVSPNPAVTAPTQEDPSRELTDEELLKLAEPIEIFDERPDKPFDRDTSVRFTGEQLAARGAVDLGTALALLPDVTIREAGRGGSQVDIRGAKKGDVSILVDGVLVSDPYYGVFDPTTIPVTDIVQIRVSTTPQSPIDGPGGPGGVIEVHTRDAIGPQLVIGRLNGDTHPTFGATASARVALAKHLALRVSTSNLLGGREHELPNNASIGEGKRAATGGARLEYRRGTRRLVLDAFLDDRSYVAPPSEAEDSATQITVLDEMSFRTSAKLDDSFGKLQVQAQGWAHSLDRRTTFFGDPELEVQNRQEIISAQRFGGMALATRPFRRDFRWIASGSLGHEAADVVDNGIASRGELSLAELASGLQYERKRFRVDGAVGVAIPIGVGANPWPESKLVAKYKPVRHLELTATAGYKGRLPSLRERFDAEMGDPTLAPENVAHTELRLVTERSNVRFELAPHYRYSSGLIKKQGGRFANTGALHIYGVDALARIRVHPRVELGAGLQYVRARTTFKDNPSTTLDDDPLEFLPHHKVEGSAEVTIAPGITARGRVRYVGPAYDQRPLQTSPPNLGAHVLVEGNLTAQLGKGYLAVLRIDDALDRRPKIRALPVVLGAGRVVSLVVQGTWE